MPTDFEGRPVTLRIPRRFRTGMAATIVAAVAAAGLVSAPVSHAEPSSDITAFDAVDQFIGTGFDHDNGGRGNDHYGNTYPGATVPFGMVQSSPTTYKTEDGEQFGGYEYSADQLRGFGMTRLSGTGCRSNYGGFDFPVMPYTGEMGESDVLPTNPAESISEYFLDFKHEDEAAEPGYYSVGLEDGVDVELTSTTRTSVSRYAFDDNATLMFDAAGSNNDVSYADIAFDPETGELSGSVTANIVCNGGDPYTAYFSATFDQQVEAYGTWDAVGMETGDTVASTESAHGSGMWLTFEDGADVTSKTGLSYVSVEGARNNASSETQDVDFDEIRAQARGTWEEALGTVDAQGGTEDERVKLYTALYHALLHPNTFQDADGRYRGFDDEVHQIEDGRDFYVNFSGWDMYRGQAQLLAMLFPERGSDINQSIVAMVEQSGQWTSWPTYNRVQTKMSGDSLQTIVASIDDFGSTDYNREAALESMVQSQSLPATDSARSDAAIYGVLGWVPADRNNAATSRTLEYATNDFSIAQLAQRLGDEEAYDLFSQRGQNWKNVFNFAREHIDGRDKNGFINAPLNTQGNQFEQSTGKQYGFNVTQNMDALIEARGGVETATEELDAVLEDLDGGAFSETAYLANQPSFILPWVYNWLQDPAKTTDTLYRATTELFDTTPSGLYGNDDLGSLSAWYVWANIGMMPAIWGTADMVVSAPMFESITISSQGSDRTVEINAPGAGSTTKYATGLSVNGTSQTASWLPASFMQNGGGTLDFTMDTEPGSWGTGEDDVPPSYDHGENVRNSVGTTNDGAVNMGGLDGGGTGLSRQDLEAAGVTGGAEISMGETGVTFTWPDTAPGEADHWIPNGQVLDFEDTPASGISFMGLATNGPSRGTAEVTYTDGTTQDVDVRFSDWVPGSIEPGNVRLIELTQRNTLDGGSDSAAPVVFGTSVVPLDEDKTVSSVTLPTEVSQGIMHIFDVALRPVATQDEDPENPEDPATQLPTRPTPQAPTEPTIPEAPDLEGTELITEETQWRYSDTGDDPAEGLDSKTAWTAEDFDDSEWSTGSDSFGAKRGEIADLGGGYTPATLVDQYKEDTTDNKEAFFFRTTVELDDELLERVESLSGRLAYDDAARVYVNGEQVAGFRDGRIDAAETNMVYAGDNESNPSVDTFSVDAEVLRSGTNTIAVQVHNTNAGSSDIFMKLEELSVVASDAPAAVSDVVLTVGADQTERNLTFYTDREVPAQVQIAPTSARTSEDFPEAEASIVEAETNQAPDQRFSNKATLEGLAEDTSYLYRVGNDEMGWSRSYELWTGTYDETFSFVFLSDAQIGASGNWETDGERWDTALGTIADLEPDTSLIVSGGDQVESHTSEDEYAAFLEPELLKQLPWAVVPGNHDNQSQAYDAHFNIPNRSTEHGYEDVEGRAGGNYWYIYNDVLYLNLNSNARSPGEEDHIEFVREVVEEHGDDVNWTVATWHHSIYSAAFHSVETDVIERREALAPVMSELGVDLVLSGHDHIYTRSYLMDGTEPAGDLEAQQESGVTLTPEDGEVLYLTANSASGSKFYGIDDNSPDAAVKDQSNQPQYTDIDVSPEALTLSTYQTFDRTMIDQVTITQDATAPELEGVHEEVEVAQGQPFEPLEGITATDASGGDLTSAITVDGSVDTATPGTYELVYTVKDASELETTATTQVTVTAVPPTLGGVPAERTEIAGVEFDPLEGVTATDANGQDITDSITVEEGASLLRMALPEAGTYVLVYSVTDDYGSTATARSTVTVTSPEEPGEGEEPGDGETPGEGEEPGDGETPGESDEPGDGETPTEEPTEPTQTPTDTGSGDPTENATDEPGATSHTESSGPNDGEASDDNGSSGDQNDLANTGANMWLPWILGMVLIALGAVLVIRHQRVSKH
ncbi:GH92 family glycosyl hydrolase [Yaniella flava]